MSKGRPAGLEASGTFWRVHLSLFGLARGQINCVQKRIRGSICEKDLVVARVRACERLFVSRTRSDQRSIAWGVIYSRSPFTRKHAVESVERVERTEGVVERLSHRNSTLCR